jgi:CPA1 family monovalent cation:H+ antiporter
VILVRIVWVMGANAVRGRRTPAARRHAVVVAWCGMRGTVTLAAALALPASFPHRDLILFASFLVVLGTLVLQGLTLKPLMARLGIEHDPRSEAADLLRRKYQVRLEQAEARMGGEASGGPSPSGQTEYAAAARAAMAAERRRLSALRADGTIGDDAFHKVEEELDRAELSAEAMHPED